MSPVAGTAPGAGGEVWFEPRASGLSPEREVWFVPGLGPAQSRCDPVRPPGAVRAGQRGLWGPAAAGGTGPERCGPINLQPY